MKKSHHLKTQAKNLRRNQTDAEARLWYWLKNRQFQGVKFRRQQQIENYIIDFVCIEHNLIIEVDGGQHNDTLNINKDNRRTTELEQKGYKVLRFWDNDVLQNTDGVLETIRNYFNANFHPHPSA